MAINDRYNRGSQKVRCPVFSVNEGMWRQEKHTDTFGQQSCIFPHIFLKFSALFLTRNEIFQSLAVQGMPYSRSHFWTTPIPPHSPDWPLEISLAWQTENLLGRRGPSDSTVKAEVQDTFLDLGWILLSNFSYFHSGTLFSITQNIAQKNK